MIVPYPLLEAAVHELYEAGLPSGERVGWPSVDALYTVAPGQWTLVTGIPGAGKSEFVDAIMVRLAEKRGWRFAVFSPENQPVQLHAAKLLEKYLGKPFGAGPTQRMTKDEMAEGLDFITTRFSFLKFDSAQIVEVLNEAIAASFSCAQADGVVIDPWNQLDHFRLRDQTEAEYLSWALGQVLTAARGLQKQMHLWIVAHPKVIQKDRDGKRPVPTPYDISGGAHWFNKADNIITVHRNAAEANDPVQIHVQKIRFKHIGRVGAAELRYDRVTGRYHEILKTVDAPSSYSLPYADR